MGREMMDGDGAFPGSPIDFFRLALRAHAHAISAAYL